MIEKRIIRLLFFAFFAISVSSAQPDDAAQIPSKIRVPQVEVEGAAIQHRLSDMVAAIYCDIGHPPPLAPDQGQQNPAPENPKIIIALYEDETIIWSRDAISGGAPYYVAAVPKDEIQAFRKDIQEQIRKFKIPLQGQHFPPDSAYTSLFVNTSPSRVYLQSAHELFEKNANLVSLGGGIQALNSRSRSEALAKDKPEYREFREMWSGIKSRLQNMVPAKTDPGVSTITLTAEYAWIH